MREGISGIYLYADLKWPAVKEAVTADRVVVLSVGSTEDHGYHLPLDTDAFIGWSIAAEACKKSGCALLLPQVPFGFNDHHMDFLGTIAIKPQHLIDFICDITASVAHHGFQRMVLVNSHGSNEPLLEIAARRSVIEQGILCATVGVTALNGGMMNKVLTTAIHSHAEEFETSLYLHLNPAKVDMTKATKEERVQPSKFFWRGSRRDPTTGTMQSSPVKIMDWWSAYTESGVIGDATQATAEKGKAIYDASVEGLAAFFQEFQGWEIRPRVDYHAARRTRREQKG